MSRIPYAVPLALCVTALSILAGCNDEPGPLGIRLLPARDSIRVETATSYATGNSSYLHRISGTSTSLLTGMNNGIEARALIRFDGFASVPSANAIDSVSLTLSINYRFLDSTGTLAFSVRKMLKEVTPSTFRWDSSNAPGAYSDTISGVFLRAISPLDSTITLRLDTTLIRDWMSTNTGTMIFLPQGSIIAGFTNGISNTVDYRPLLTIYHHDTSGTAATLPLRSTWGMYVADGTIPMPSDRITLQAGISTRGVLRFDSLGVPPLSSVTEANLRLPIDTTQSLSNTHTVDKIDAFIIIYSLTSTDSASVGVTLLPVDDNGQKVYQANVRFLVQQWLLHQVNVGITLRATAEQTTLDRFVLYGAAAPDSLRPKLAISYTLLP